MLHLNSVAALMLQYLEDWYVASCREPYYDQHPQTDLNLEEATLAIGHGKQQRLLLYQNR